MIAGKAGGRRNEEKGLSLGRVNRCLERLDVEREDNLKVMDHSKVSGLSVLAVEKQGRWRCGVGVFTWWGLSCGSVKCIKVFIVSPRSSWLHVADVSTEQG